MQITKDTIIEQIVTEHPELVEVLMQDYELHCFGCMGSSIETLGEGLGGHGLSEEEIEDAIIALNTLIQPKK